MSPVATPRISAQRERMLSARLFFACVGLPLAACASDDDAIRVAAEPDPGWLLYTELEERLMRAATFELHATLSTTGAIDADVNADLWLGTEQRARFAVKGVFQGKPVDALWVSDGARARVRGGPTRGAPEETRDAFVRGLLAMGLMHNAALLAGGDAPAHIDGGVRDAIRAERQRMAAEGLAIDLDVVVRREVMAEATLTLDGEGLPRDRVQVVRFETGDMHVKEIYSRVLIDVPMEDALFALDPPAMSAVTSTAPLEAPQ